MSVANLNEIKNYLLEDGTEYRKNILLYLRWVLEEYENRKESHSSIVQKAFDNTYPFYIEGIKTKNEWNRINKRGLNDFLIEHKTSKKDGQKSGWLICVKPSKDELESFLNLFEKSDFPEKIITWDYKMPTEEDFRKAIEEYNESEWTASQRKVIIDDKEYQLKALSSIAIGIANNLDSPANFYMFTTNELENYIKQEFEDFKIIESKNSSNEANDQDDEYNVDDDKPNDKKQIQPLNQILYGPPGTGKTYNTINKAIEIIENRVVSEEEKREDLKAKFEEYKKAGQIEFVTFHQSYGYEEFVEGIKAQTITDDETKKNTITYDVEPGVFKQLCEQAKIIKSEKKSIYTFNEKEVNIWKISLGDSQNSEDEYLFDYCIENNKILLGFGDGLDFSECKNRDEIAKKLNDSTKYSYPPTAINTLKNKIKKDDIVLVSYGNRKLRAIAKITSDYEHLDDDNLKTYVQARSVDWLLVPDEAFSYEKILKKQFSQMSIYDIKNNVKIDALRNLLSTNKTDENIKNYILIIDEINRGNISKIFGELITLIESTKRIGADEEIRVKLPYSGDNSEPFGVPQNLYIIGTMNTADRSIAPIDTALRRRFVFEEMAPKSSLLSSDIEGINLQSLLEAINTRIEYLYDRDHTIGHAYLIDVVDLDDLKFAFRNKIIPLLAEYFYEDWENIDLVLNKNGMIEEEKSNSDYLKNINKINGKKIYKVSDEKNWTIDNFKKIYNDKALDKTDE